jgi:hypothetical protein
VQKSSTTEDRHTKHLNKQIQKYKAALLYVNIILLPCP